MSFVAVPNILIGNMDANALLCLSKLYSFHRMNMKINTTNKYLSEFLGTSIRNVSRIINQLVKDGYIITHCPLGKMRSIEMTKKTIALFDEMNMAQKKASSQKYKKRLADDINEPWFEKYLQERHNETDAE